MVDFRVKTQLLDVVRFVGSIVNLAFIVGVFLVAIFATTHYTYITNTNPPSPLYPPYGLPDFRPAIDVPALAPQSVLYQEQALYGFTAYFLIETNWLRILFPILWYFSMQYIKNPTFFFLPAAVFFLAGIIEIIRFIIFLVLRLTPALYFIVTYPNIAAVESNEFKWLFWSTLVTIGYLAVMIILVIIIIIQSKQAGEEERQEFIENRIGTRMERNHTKRDNNGYHSIRTTSYSD